MIARLLVLALLTAHHATAPAVTTTALVTAYTCEAHPANPMHPCGVPRWGEAADAWKPGLACPVAWRGQWVRVPGHGTLQCDDTPRDDYIGGLPHLDLRLATYDAAMRWGVRVVEVEVERIVPPRPPKHWTHERHVAANQPELRSLITSQLRSRND